MKKEKEFENISLIRKIAWSFHKSTGLDWDDLFQESYLAYRYALDHYNPESNVKISAFIWIHVRNQLNSYYQKEQQFLNPLKKAYRRDQKANENLSAWIPSNDCYNQCNFELECLSADAQKIADIVLNTAKKFIKLSLPQTRERLTNILTNQGWTKERIQNGIRDIMLVCSES